MSSNRKIYIGSIYDSTNDMDEQEKVRQNWERMKRNASNKITDGGIEVVDEVKYMALGLAICASCLLVATFLIGVVMFGFDFFNMVFDKLF